MPWQSNGGGDKPNPWGNGGSRGNGGSGGRPGGGSGGGGGQEPPNIDEFLRQGQDRLKKILPGGSGGIFLVVLVAAILWLVSGIYLVGSNEQAVVLRFGKFVTTTGSGPHWHLPYPIESVEIRGVTDENIVEVGGVSTTAASRGRQSISSRDESLMLTGDENIVDVRFSVIWKINDLGKYLFNLAEPQITVKSVSESVMREQIGQNQIGLIITSARGQLEEATLEGVQQTLDEYESGIEIVRVQIDESQAPSEVKEAFLEVQRAKADQQRYQNQAEGYRESVVPAARGEAQRVLQQAEAYAASVVARADGEAERFKSIYNEYRQAKSVTRKRIYLETMEQILAGMDKIILDGQAGSGVVPYLPLDQIQRNQRNSDTDSGENDDDE